MLLSHWCDGYLHWAKLFYISKEVITNIQSRATRESKEKSKRRPSGLLEKSGKLRCALCRLLPFSLLLAWRFLGLKWAVRRDQLGGGEEGTLTGEEGSIFCFFLDGVDGVAGSLLEVAVSEVRSMTSSSLRDRLRGDSWEVDWDDEAVWLASFPFAACFENRASSPSFRSVTGSMKLGDSVPTLPTSGGTA